MRLGLALAALAVLAGCVSAPAPPAPPAPAPGPAAAPPAPPPPPPASWQEGTVTAGDWRYSESPRPQASFGDSAPLMTIVCTADRQLRLVRSGSADAASSMAIRTTMSERSLPTAVGAEGTVATLGAADPLLDEIAFSRGRILVQVPGQADLVLPTWPEPARVIEDCRGQ